MSAQIFPLDGTKHDLSSAVTKSYYAKDPAQGGTTEICIFCHTPHSGNTEAPLWNRAASTANYVPYTSDVLVELGYWPAEDPRTGVPHSKTRICLSCHDGTIALGSVVNMPNNISSTYTEIQMFGNSNIQKSSPGYIDIDMRGDHPVAIKHDWNKDKELVTGSAVAGGVRLYKDNGAGVAVKENADGNYVECTSCHNPHDNQYGKFLVDSNTNSKICTSCHDKAGDDSTVANESIHSNSANYSNAYPAPATLGSTVQNVKCMVCHYPHKSGVLTTDMNTPNPGSGKYLLTFKEEQSCYNTPNRWNQSNSSCHDNGGAGKGIKAEVTKGSGYAHRVGNYSSLHNATEGRSVSAGGTGWLGVAGNGWHVECDDCHNSHTAGRLTHTPPGNGVNSTLAIYGAGGAEPPTPYGAWSAPLAVDYTNIEPIGVLRISGINLGVTKEYQICLKCHSSFAWGSGSVPTSPSLNAPMTDQAKEFNTANSSFHPVMGVGINAQGTLNASWAANKGNQTMYCSDCHNNSTASPQGPHGSGNAFILTMTYNDTYTSNKTLVQSSGLGSSDDLCFQCHTELVYQSGAAGQGGTGFSGGGINLHTQHRLHASASGTSTFGYRCVNCHTRVSHGYNRKAMIVTQGEGAPYEAGTTGAGKIKPGISLAGSGTYPVGFANRDANCTTVAGCHQ
jgi:predicted CXXCH cytochrome family protein